MKPKIILKSKFVEQKTSSDDDERLQNQTLGSLKKGHLTPIVWGD